MTLFPQLWHIETGSVPSQVQFGSTVQFKAHPLPPKLSLSSQFSNPLSYPSPHIGLQGPATPKQLNPDS